MLLEQILKPFVKGFKYPIYPDNEQIEIFEKTFGCCRYVWNRAINDAKLEYEHYLAHKELGITNNLLKPSLSGYEFVNRLMKYKQDTNSLWLNEVNAISLQQTMLHLGSAFSRFFKARKGYPQLKKKYNKQTFTLMNNGFRFKDGQLYLAKLKNPLKIIFSRPLPSEPTSAVISKTPSGKYYISFVCEYFPEKTNGQNKIGIDLGLKDFLVTSDGIKISNPKHFVTAQKKLKRKQQALARKQKGSRNRNKARLAVAVQHEHIVNCRKDFLHKLSRKLVNENQVIGLEKLVVKNMVKNHKLSKAISDVSWSSFTEMLNYKSRESQNCSLVYMDVFFPSSHLCNKDGAKRTEKLKLSERSWICEYCGSVLDRDINAAINIKNKALETLLEFNISNNSCVRLIAER